MELRQIVRRAITVRHNPAKRRVLQQCRFYATPTDSGSTAGAGAGASGQQGDIQAAAPITFTTNSDQFAAPRAELVQDRSRPRRTRRPDHAGGRDDHDQDLLLRRVRIVPASPSYFTATPEYMDNLLELSSLLRAHQTLPMLPPGQAPRVAWKTIDQYKTELAEPVRVKGYGMLIKLLRRLNHIHPSLMPAEVTEALEKYKRHSQPYMNAPKPIEVNEYGVSAAVGRRKSSSAKAYLVEGTGECMINGKRLSEYFGRLHDRESAVWALKSTQRLDKYNVWALAKGGGTTGQAEAITLAVAKALLAHEPDLKPALRRAGCVTRDPRRVERKKPGHLKARKMPTWVKR
ncbi:hypothetical protein BAUCODRAFT_38346 [Baudoinia panamericana UAMH 10762]|uniref:Small ribosomal subunit protein uS9m n=1 Tax=Baudoinia panamericana (strain UAMH 10762) TaxID=717646 RepID=M2LE99_BAUPA|nr:uncharacterized protein BAUCODRAFT_38346 [Baudoinia panamericana UAMH 10762]EMC92312.1 hypothetical protein BAUCODRAFT_38346 [Baudoinia panamericana UAMH 10762]